MKKTVVETPRTLTGKIALNLPEIEQWMASGFSQTEILGFLASRGVECSITVFRVSLQRARKKAARYGGEKHQPVMKDGRIISASLGTVSQSGGLHETGKENKGEELKSDVRDGVVFVPQRPKTDNYKSTRSKSDLI